MNIKLLSGWLLLLLFVAACQTVPSESLAAATAVSKPQSTAVPVTAVLTPTPSPEPTPDPLAPPVRRLNAGDLLLAADIDDIPAIFATDDLFVDAATGSQEWLDDELIIALELNGETRAYPIRLLSLHEIVNDTIGGEPVIITWCPLCFSAIVFNPIVDGRPLTFGVSGFLYNDNLVMYDHQTNTLWSQLAGQAIRGALRGTQLPVFPSLMTSWGEWKALHPDTRVLSTRQKGRQDDIIDPYAGYYTSGAAGFSTGLEQNELLPAKSLVIGLVAGKEARAYPLAVVQAEGLINDQLGILPVLFIFDEALGAVLVYNREVAGQVLTLTWADREGFLRDVETGSLWEVQTGVAVEGPMKGESLPELSGPLVFWFAWSAFNPQTDVYGTAEEKE